MLADEPTAGLSQSESDHVIELSGNAFGAETAILLIEHKIAAVEALCPRSMLLSEGRLIVDTATSDMRRDPRLANVYFGPQLPLQRNICGGARSGPSAIARPISKSG